MTTHLASAVRVARGVRSFDGARRRSSGEWEFDWQFGVNDDAFAGHFPHQPILPGVFLLEMSQRAAEHALQADTGRTHRVFCVQQFRFIAPVLPGDACGLLVQWRPEEAAHTDLIELKVSFSKGGSRVAHGVLAARGAAQ